VAFTLKECRLRSAPGFGFRLEQRYGVLFRHHQSIFVPSVVALQLGTFRFKTALKYTSRQRAGKVFGNDTVPSHISILLQKEPLTDKRTQIVTYKNLSTSIPKIETNKMRRFEGGTSNCLQLISYVFLPIWTIIREPSDIKSVQKLILSFLVWLLLPTRFWCRGLLLHLNTLNNTHIHTR
jgi:hypothetical protein